VPFTPFADLTQPGADDRLRIEFALVDGDIKIELYLDAAGGGQFTPFVTVPAGSPYYDFDLSFFTTTDLANIRTIRFRFQSAGGLWECQLDPLHPVCRNVEISRIVALGEPEVPALGPAGFATLGGALLSAGWVGARRIRRATGSA